MDLSDKPGSALDQVSPEYRRECLEMAIRAAVEPKSAKDLVNAAKAFYAYIHEGK